MTPNPPNEPENQVMLISYKTLRTIVGVLGMFLSTILVVGMAFLSNEPSVQRSISLYYHTRMGDVFVGLLTAISLFLFVYKGPEKKDHWLGNIAGIHGLIVAFVPTRFEYECQSADLCDVVNRASFNAGWTPVFHLISAGIFLLVLAAFSLWLFPKTAPGMQVQKGTQKYKRNIVYYVSGVIIILCVATLAIGFKFFDDELKGTKLTFILETVALFFFGISWLVKGEQFILKDQRHAASP